MRVKGSLELHVLRKQGEGASRVISGDKITPDDTLRFQVSLPTAGRVSIVGIEPDGTLYPAWPLADHAAETLLPAGAKQSLPGAVQLDGPSGAEHLYVVLCPDGVDPKCASAGPARAPKCAADCTTGGFNFVRP